MKKMRYTEALRKLFEVMEGRPDIKEIKFDRENDSFNVISDTGIHVCFGNEFRKSNKDEIKNMQKYYVIQNAKGKFFKVDNLSGGYPCFIDNFEFCEKYNSKQFAEDFLKSNYATQMFQKEFADCVVKKVKMIVE